MSSLRDTVARALRAEATRQELACEFDDADEAWRKEADAALAAIREACYAVVPREPTMEMLQAVLDANRAAPIKFDVGYEYSMASVVWNTMLAAAPRNVEK